MVKLRRLHGVAAGIALVVIAWWLWPSAPKGPPKRYVFAIKPPQHELEPPEVAPPLDPRVGAVTLKLNGKLCTPAGTRLKAGETVAVSGSVLASPQMLNGQRIESIGLSVAYRDNNPLGWAALDSRSVTGPGAPDAKGVWILQMGQPWTVPDVHGDALLMVLVTITETGKRRPFYTAATYPVTIE